MARNGTGTYDRAVSSYVAGTTINQDTVNQEMDDIATALTGSIAKNGETVPTADLPMGTYKHTGVGNGSARTHYAAMGQVQDGKVNWVDGGGTADAITATYSPAITALVDGQLCHVRATAANATTTPTFSPNSLTARTIVKNGGVALAAGDIVGDGHELILRYDLANTRWELLNPTVILSGYQPLDATLTALAGTLTAANKITYATALNTAGELDFKDEDNMASNSATALPSQQSVKAYVDTEVAAVPTTGRVAQTVYSSTSAVATGATTLPYDDTIPQNTEGNEYLTASITPASATNKLLIEACFHLAGDTSGIQSIALFQDATAGALAVGSADSGAVNVHEQVLLTHYMDAGTTSATTFKIRGGSSAGTQTLNGEGGTRRFGGVYTSWLRVTEVST